ncbi:nose resistant to fluoxetine protein 6 isoform X2 [Cephus cinctus]|uniref:Nose resistant to fluoxetine protein 6 isoform X2 n=1 Tax=Cephus cinctus TaxID=211228 RepID=A0AAJ7RM37_CEPCN|nr:nose resistant to fluoxetine protein 6 isoform X2 [Cephus cinctus]
MIPLFDSSAKLSPGVITGNIKQLGNYDECLSVETGYDFIGQACSVTVQFKFPENPVSVDDLDARDLFNNAAVASGMPNAILKRPMIFEWLWCVPSTCNYSEISAALNLALDPLRVKDRIEMMVSVDEHSCHTLNTDKRLLDQWDVAYISILGIFLVIVITSTTYDVIKIRHQSKTRKDSRNSILTSFSIYTNGKNLLNTNRRADSITCLDGIRFLSICWVIYLHTYFHQIFNPKLNLTSVFWMIGSFRGIFAFNGNVATDSFFLLSGTLLAYTNFSKKQKNPDKTFDILSFYVHRYIRLTPAYAMVIGFYATLFYKLGSGPYWNKWIAACTEPCRKNWWTNLLYVNNYVIDGQMCLDQSWYLSVDMQLVWLSPIFLYPMLRFKRSIFFWSILGTGILISILVPFFITYYYELPGTMIYTMDLFDVTKVFVKIYKNVYTRAGPHIMGLGLGYLLCKTRSRSLNIPNRYVIAGWLIGMASGLAVVFGPYNMYKYDYVYNKIEASFYAGLHRHVFALFVAWIIFTSVHGYGGFVNQFLSWRGWVPLSKLTYCIFLCHFIIILYDSGNTRISSNFTTFTGTNTFLGYLVLSVILAVILHLFFEVPFITLSRILTRSLHRGIVPQGSRKTFENNGSDDTLYKSWNDTRMTASQIYTTESTDAGRSSPDYANNFLRNVNKDFYVDKIECPRNQENPYISIMGSTHSNSNTLYALQGLREQENFDTKVRREKRELHERDSNVTAGKSFDNKAFEDTS